MPDMRDMSFYSKLENLLFNNQNKCHPFFHFQVTFNDGEQVTLPADMFGVSEFWLQTRVIIKILAHPC